MRATHTFVAAAQASQVRRVSVAGTLQQRAHKPEVIALSRMRLVRTAEEDFVEFEAVTLSFLPMRLC